MWTWYLLAVLSAFGLAAQQTPAPLCTSCHQQIAESFAATGMGRSFAPASEKTVPPQPEPYFHSPSESYFQTVFRDGQIYQRRYQIDGSGIRTNLMEKRADFVMGSGNHARALLHRTPAGTLLQLPLGWYAENGGYWAMNPGYDRTNHEGFRREIPYDCMFCHNAYPKVSAANLRTGEAPAYPNTLPSGIDCARCHGDGARHAALAARAGSGAPAIRAAIINPGRMAPDRQLELCMSCHLESTSAPLPNAIVKHGRGPFSFQPGEPLADFLLNFDHAPQSGHSEKFEIVSSAYRLRQSACFNRSAGKLLCTTCHDPHRARRAEEAVRHTDAACRNCHNSPLSTAAHIGPAATSGCAACHMPKRRTEDVIHVVMTDHRILRRPPPGDLLAQIPERHDAYRGEVVPYYPATLPKTADGELYLALAQVQQKSNLTAGIVQLQSAIARHKPARAAWYLHLAEALDAAGRLPEAVPWFQQAAQRDPASSTTWRKLGVAFRRSRRLPEAIDALRKSITLSGERALAWHELALAHRDGGNAVEAGRALERAIALDPELAEAHNNLGVLALSAQDSPRAEAAFREAIRIDPSYADAHGNLANLLAGASRAVEAEAAFTRALSLRPADAGTRYNFATLLGRLRRYDESQHQLDACIQADPNFADGRELLGRLLLARNQPAQAAIHYRVAVRLRPNSPPANFGLGLALLQSGDRAQAIAYLKQAASGKGPAAQDAAEVIRQLREPQ